MIIYYSHISPLSGRLSKWSHKACPGVGGALQNRAGYARSAAEDGQWIAGDAFRRREEEEELPVGVGGWPGADSQASQIISAL